jgi:hypothetical protein
MSAGYAPTLQAFAEQDNTEYAAGTSRRHDKKVPEIVKAVFPCSICSGFAALSSATPSAVSGGLFVFFTVCA